MTSIQNRSGNESSEDPVVAFLYILMRDHVGTGVVEEIAQQIAEETTWEFSNGWLARYAKDVAERLSHVDNK